MSRARFLSCLLVSCLAAACSSGGGGTGASSGAGVGSASTGGTATGSPTTGGFGPCTLRCTLKNQACQHDSSGTQVCGCKTGFFSCAPTGSPIDCINEQTDNDNCGSCGNACTLPLTCDTGHCGCNPSATIASCPIGDGGHVCAELTTDPNHCGGCKNVCGPDATCNYDADAGGPAACVCGDASLSACAGVCVDITTDTNNCGCCGAVCMPADAGGPATTCSPNNGGTCQCQEPWEQCQTCGPCVDTAYDVNNCGGCGTACFANGGPVACDGGHCFCGPEGTGTICFDGTCPDLLSDVTHCGNCNVQCEAIDAGVACVDGHCFCGADAGGIICPNGICSSLYDDPRNCGTCGTECFVPNPYCVDGGCTSAPSG